MFHHTGGKPCKCFLSLISPKSSDYIVKCVTNIIPMPLAWTFKNSATVGWSHFYQKIVTTVKHCSPKRMPRRVTCSITLGESLVIAFFVTNISKEQRLQLSCVAAQWCIFVSSLSLASNLKDHMYFYHLNKVFQMVSVWLLIAQKGGWNVTQQVEMPGKTRPGTICKKIVKKVKMWQKIYKGQKTIWMWTLPLGQLTPLQLCTFIEIMITNKIKTMVSGALCPQYGNYVHLQSALDLIYFSHMAHWKDIWKHTVAKDEPNAVSVIMYLKCKRFEGSFKNYTLEKN